MTCCIIAMLIIAHVTAMIRRWGMFWGLVRIPEGVEIDTAWQRLMRWLARPGVRMAMAALIALETAAVGGWLYVEHGAHIYQIGDTALGRVRGETIVYSQVCGPDGESRTVRLVIARGHSGAST